MLAQLPDRKHVRFFIDESGTPDDYIHDVHTAGEQYFTLCAVAIEQATYLEFEKGIEKIAEKYQKYLLGKEIKCRSIRRSNPVNPPKPDSQDKNLYEFHKYEDGQEQYSSFCKDMNQLLIATKFDALSVTVNKLFAKQNYPNYDILETALNDLWERICIYKYIYNCKDSTVHFDPRGYLSDMKVFDSYQQFLSNGTSFVDKDYISGANLVPTIYNPDSKDSYGLQLADLYAYPIRAYHERGISPHFESVIKQKLFVPIKDPVTDKFIQMGLKLTLSK